ncbi:hypothetical protein B0H19DRAFT_1365224 [Mycena capillaripes]|nr:hypothetical protein B0H19DRAFT_1365224 [Mycena capillaripes]
MPRKRLSHQSSRLLADSVASFTTHASLSLCYAPVRPSPASRLLFFPLPFEALAAILKTTRALDIKPIKPGLVWKVVFQYLHDSRSRTWLGICLEAGPHHALLRNRAEERSGCIESPHALAVDVPSAASLRGAAAPLVALSADDSPHPFCVDENPHVRLGIAYGRCEPTSRALYSIIFFGRRERNKCLPRSTPRSLIPAPPFQSRWHTYDTSQPRHTFAQKALLFYTAVVGTHSSPYPRRSSAAAVPCRVYLASLIALLHTIDSGAQDDMRPD